MSQFDILLKEWFDRCLSPGCCYSSNGKPFTSIPENGKLVYQDGTAC